MTSIPASAVDGRSLRRERNRQDIVDALLGLIKNGETEISAALIASKAGLSERSIFRYFDDVNDLYRSVCDLAFSKEIEYALIDDAGVGSLDTKIENFVNQRVRIYTMNEKIAPAARSFAFKNPIIKNQLVVGRKLLRTQIMKHFAEELSVFDKQQQQVAVAIIDSLTTFEYYDMMRSDQKMSVQAIKSVLTESIRKALQ
jgi:TetR/AcrR family transcriptional regulator, regulator of autoinduction and epiphytic fitness